MDENRLSCLLDKEFLDDYKKFAQAFDEIAGDLFKGPKLESLAKNFLNKHRNYIDSFPFESKNYKFPNCSQNDIIEEDYRIVNEENGNKDSKCQEQQQQQNCAVLATPQQLMADIYRRACQGSYLRLTLNKSRHSREEDRREPVDYARHAIRYDSGSFLATYWFMISLGWQLNNVTNPKERTHLGRAFRHSALRCISLNPDDPMAHHLNGRYFYNIAGLSWIERTIGKSLLGVKIEGSYQDAERALLQAKELNADWLSTGLWLARVLLAQQRPMDEVKRWIDYGLSLKPLDPTAEIERNELLELRAKLKLCSN